MVERAGQQGRRSWSGRATVLLSVLLAAAGCGHDWSSAGPDDAAGADADTDGGGEGAEDAGRRDDATVDDADVVDDAVPPGCGNGTLETGEECDPPDSRGSCDVATCEGDRTCDNACRWGACDFGLRPAGDGCDESTPPEIVVGSEGSGTFTGSTCGATDDGVVSVCGGAGVPDVLYRLELAQASAVTLDTFGSGFRTVLRLLQGPDCPGTDVTCNAGVPGDPLGSSRLELNLPAGSYWVVVDGADAAARGDYVLNATITPALPVTNDSCVGAIPLSLYSMPSTVTGTTVGADADPLSCDLGLAGPDVWYRLSLGERYLVYLDLLDDQTWDSVLDVRQGSCPESSSVACEDDACGTERSRFVGWLDPGEYLVGVDGRTVLDSGAFTLRYQALRQSRRCMGAAQVIAADGSYLGSTLGSVSADDPSCAAGFTVPDVVYAVSPCPGREFVATTCAPGTTFNTVLTLRDARCTVELACNDDDPACDPAVSPFASRLTYAAPAPGLYLLIVDGMTSGGYPDRGPFALQVSGL